MVPHERVSPSLRSDPNAKRILLIEFGSFSLSNFSIRSALARQYPSLDIDVIDIGKEFETVKWSKIAAVPHLLIERGPQAFVSSRSIRFHTIRSAWFGRLVREIVERRRGRAPILFTLQTQSLFDASLDDVPHCIYTDFAALGRRWSSWRADDPPPHPRWVALEREIYTRADRVFTFGSRVRDLIAHEYGAGAGKVRCVGAGPNAEIRRDRSNVRPRSILFIGVEWERKGGPELVEAFARVRAVLPDATLTIVGCAPRVSGPGIEVVGRQPPAKISDFFARAACFCMPSRLEPFGIVYVEALHAGTAIVASDCGDQRDVVRDGENGFVVPVGDVAALAGALIDVLADPERCAAMGAASATLAPHFTWDAVVKRIVAEMAEASAAVC